MCYDLGPIQRWNFDFCTFHFSSVSWSFSTSNFDERESQGRKFSSHVDDLWYDEKTDVKPVDPKKTVNGKIFLLGMDTKIAQIIRSRS